MTPIRFSLAIFIVLMTVSLAPAKQMVSAVCLAKADAESDEPSPQLVAAVEKLKELGVMTNPNYWLEFARKGRTCEGSEVHDLIMAGANKITKADNVEEAIAILMDKDVLQNSGGAEYWQKKAVEGMKCPGSFVESLIIRMADVL